MARRWLARLPFAEADLLIIDEIGKDVSGSGMDTNVVGRKRAALRQRRRAGRFGCRRCGTSSSAA